MAELQVPENDSKKSDFMHKDIIKSRLNGGNTCSLSGHNIVPFLLLSKNIKFKMCRSIIFLMSHMGKKLAVAH